MAITNALMKLGGKSLEKGSKKAVEKVADKAIEKIAENAATKAVAKSAVRGLTGAGMSSLAAKSGSTLDGILGKSSGLRLPEAKLPQRDLAKLSGGTINTVGDFLRDGESFSDIKPALSTKNYTELERLTRDAADINGSSLDAIGVSSKSNLPTLNREQYYNDTIGKVGRRGISSADVPSYMQQHLTTPSEVKNGMVAQGDNDEILRTLFNDNESPLSDLYDRYDELARSGNANDIFTPENVDTAIAMSGDKGNEITNDFAGRLFGYTKDIPVSGGKGAAKSVKVSRPTANIGVDSVAESASTSNPALSDEISSLKAQLSAAGGAGNGGGANTSTGPDYGGLGDSGYNVKLKNGSTTTIKVGQGSAGSTKQQRAVRKLDDMTAKAMNTNNKQYKAVVGKSGSIDGHYKTVAERMRAEKIDQANVADKAKAALAIREDIKQQGLQYAENNGVTLDLSGIDNTVGLNPTQKRKLAELGLGLDDMLGGSSVVTPTQAEDIYKTLRDYAWKWEDSNDALTSMAGKAMKKEADAVRDIIDNAMDNINVDYKTTLLEKAAANGEDPAYLRKLSQKPDFKFSDLRKDQSDWITIDDLSGNKIKDDPTLNVFGINTGAPNPFTSGAEKIKEKIYERQARGTRGGRGAGGNSGGGGVPPIGGPGAENNINFETVGGERAGTLGNLLSKAKGAGLVGAGVLGGMMLGNGAGGDNAAPGDMSVTYSDTGAQQEQEIDPYSQLTIGGYTYDQLENGYMAALQAGDSAAAKLIANMMGMLDDKVKRYQDTKDSSKSDIAAKQKAALNVLSGLMSNYQAEGPIKGNITGFLNAITGGGYNPNAYAYSTGAEGSLGTIIKALGDSGMLSEGDQQRARKLMPQITDSPEAAKVKYQQLLEIIKGAGAQ